MEEKKIGSKEVKMKAVKASDDKEQPTKKLSYEELNQACAEMSQQLQNQSRYIQQMQKQGQQMEFMLQTKRMDYLFKVVELYAEHNLFESGFVNSCIKEIQESLTIPEEESNKSNGN